MSDIYQIVTEDGALVPLETDGGFREISYNLIHMTDVFLDSVQVDDLFIYVDETGLSLKFCQDRVERTLISYGCVCQTKRHSNV